MKIRDILYRKGRTVMTVRPTETVSTLSHRLRMAKVGALVVSEDGEAVMGIVSERDVVNCLAERGAEALNTRVSEIMTGGVRTCTEGDNISAIAREMTEHRFRHMPVLDGGRLVGMISIGDIVKHRIQEMELEQGVLRDMALAGL